MPKPHPIQATDPEEAAQRAFELSLRAIGRKERTVSELREWLLAKDVDGAAVEAALERLIEIGTLDDSDYARRYAEDKRTLAGWGRDRIEENLRKRGVREVEIEHALGPVDPDEETERAVAVLAERDAGTADDRQRSRALALLVRRGFGDETAYEAIRRFAAEAAGRPPSRRDR